MAYQNPTVNYKTLLAEALPALDSPGVAIFANAPKGTQEIMLTLRTAGMTMRLDGGVPTAAGDGLDYAVNSASAPYIIPINYDSALLCKAIENGGNATGWIEYRG